MRFWLVLIAFVLCWSKALHHWKNASTLVCLGKKQLGSTFTWIVPRLVTHMKHLHTCLAYISVSIHLLSANKISFADLLKVAVTRKLGLIRDSGTYYLVFSETYKKLVIRQSRINPNFLMNASFKETTKEFLFAEQRKMNIFILNASYEWPILEQFMEKCCTFFYCPDTETDHQS